MKNRPILFFLCDGLSDRNIKELAYETPLSASRHPTMDFLANAGSCGFLDPLTPGYTCGSDTAHLSLFGADPLKYYKGRGILEAMGSYAPLVENDLVFKSSFGYLDTQNNIVVKRGLTQKTDFSRIGKLIDNLNRTLSNNTIKISVKNNKAILNLNTSKSSRKITLTNQSNFVVEGDFNIESLIHYAGGFRSIFILRGLGKLHSSKCIGLGSNDPCAENKSYLISKEQQRKIRLVLQKETDIQTDSKCICEYISFITLEIINSQIQEIYGKEDTVFSDVSGEFIKPSYLTRSASFRFKTPRFEDIHNMKGAMICNTPVVLGVGRMLGLDCFKSVDSFNEHVKNPLDKYGMIFYHFKKTDDYSHSGEWAKKLAEIEKVDKAIKSFLESILSNDKNKECKVVFTGDHTTPCKDKQHTHDPVPCFVSNIDYNKIKSIKTLKPKFSEFLYKGKIFGRIRMIDLLKMCNEL